MSKESPRTWLITGADKGLGLSTAKAALDAGDNVVVTVLAKDGDHVFTRQYPRERFLAIHLDASDLPRIAAVVEQAEQAFGGIDVLVNNAGYGLLSVAEETPPEKYRPLFEVNFFGLVEMTRAVLPGMRRRRSGRIINLSSVGGYSATQGFAFYSATKFAVEGYSEALAKEVKPLGIHVTIIEPHGFRSDFAGPSLQSELCAIDDYRPFAGDYVRDYASTRHGKQGNDPAKFGPAILRLVEAPEPPLRQPLGKDGYEFVRDTSLQVLAEIEKWKEVAFSTTVDS
jgi:NAD(P)-dependent dehydrogenase (short-subunit alcohol dehydrogenase family)